MKRIIIFLIALFSNFSTFSQSQIISTIDINQYCYLIYHKDSGYTICFKTNETHDFYISVGYKDKLNEVCNAALFLFKNRNVSDIMYVFKGNVGNNIYQFIPYDNRYIVVINNYSNGFKINILNFIDILNFLENFW